MDRDPGSLPSVRRVVSMYDVRCTEEHRYARKPSMIPVVPFCVLLSLYASPRWRCPLSPQRRSFIIAAANCQMSTYGGLRTVDAKV